MSVNGESSFTSCIELANWKERTKIKVCVISDLSTFNWMERRDLHLCRRSDGRQMLNSYSLGYNHCIDIGKNIRLRFAINLNCLRYGVNEDV